MFTSITTKFDNKNSLLSFAFYALGRWLKGMHNVIYYGVYVSKYSVGERMSKIRSCIVAKYTSDGKTFDSTRKVEIIPYGERSKYCNNNKFRKRTVQSTRVSSSRARVTSHKRIHNIIYLRADDQTDSDFDIYPNHDFITLAIINVISYSSANTAYIYVAIISVGNSVCIYMYRYLLYAYL